MITRWMEKINAMPDEKERQRFEEYLRLSSGTALVTGYDTVSGTQASNVPPLIYV